MWVRSSCQLTDSVFQVATPVSSHFLIFGEVIALVDASIAAMEPIIADVLETQLGGESLNSVLLTHAHFDHVGGLPALRIRYPGLQAFGSPLTAELLGKDDFVRDLFQKNVECSAAFQNPMPMEFAQWRAGLKIDHIVRDGDNIALGGDVEVKVIGTPGHSEDSLSFLVRPDAALTGSETLGGYRGRAKYTCSFTQSFSQFLESLDRVSNLEVRVVGLPHSGALSGELALRYFADLREEAHRLKTLFKQRLDEGEIIEEIALSIAPEWVADGIAPEGPFTSTVKDCLFQMIEAVAREK